MLADQTVAPFPLASREDEDHRALAACAEPGAALCTVVGIEGSFSRRLGAQLAITPEGRIAGSLADGCLEQQLASDCRDTEVPIVKRYGRGSRQIDFRLPCGGGLDILIDPVPDRDACRQALNALHLREDVKLALAPNRLMTSRRYIPRLAIRAFGEGPELEALATIASAAGVACDVTDKGELALGGTSGGGPTDPWTAVVMLFHDHDWEVPLLEEALSGPAFYIGAQGGLQARRARLAALSARGLGEDQLHRVRSPIGTPRGSRTPQALALSVLAEIVGEYERLRPAA
ncbi:XdhC family protein [Qipengyuania sp.]|uniref:XdhC family protein n=1 Tax=Qipengyuania sp. TaxID=2004515 RepID=UPI0035C7D1D1